MNENLIKELTVIQSDIDDIKTMIDDLKDSKINKFW